MQPFFAKVLLICAAVFAASQFEISAFATTYYVSPNGSDTNAGSSAAPFRTIQQAANLVNPGDTVIVGDGIYTGNATSILEVNRGGTSSAWVTFKSANKWGAKLNGQNNYTTDAINLRAPYVIIQDFEIYGTGTAAPTGGSTAIYSASGGYHDIVGNHIHDVGRICTDAPYGEDAIYTQVSNLTVERNLIHDVGRYGPGENGCNPSKPYYMNNDHGVYVAGANNVMVRNNIFYNVLHGWSVQVYPDTVDNLSVLNNTFAFPNPWEPGHIVLAAPMTNSRIQNNIFYRPAGGGILFKNHRYSNVAIENNITYPGNISEVDGPVPAGVAFAHNKDNTDPMFVNPLTHDFRFRSGSPAIGAGLVLSSVPNDYADSDRKLHARYNIGAF